MSAVEPTEKPRARILAFDVFGTVADWHGSIVAEMSRIAPHIDGAAFARDWRAGYRPAMDRVARGDWPWQRIDGLHRRLLDPLLETYGLQALDEAQRRDLNHVWHRLAAWPDAVEGIARLRRDYRCVTLSNGNISLLADQARHVGLAWDAVLSAEIFRRYKPDPATYLGVCEIFDVAPAEVMMVATHQSDLDAAAALGLQTAYIERPYEFGRDRPKAASPAQANDHHATDLIALAERLGT